MIINWLEFPICLSALHTFLKTSVPKADGIHATPSHFEIVEAEPFLQADIDVVNGYLTGLTEAGEAEKINHPVTYAEALVRFKEAMVLLPWESVTELGRKVIMGLPITDSDKQWIIDNYQE